MAQDFTVVAVKSAAQRRRFVSFPYEFYKENPYWIAPLRRDQAKVLDRRRNAFFEHGQMQEFLAVDGSDRVVGRVAGIVNGMHLKKHDDGNGFFGFFESVERYEVAKALLDATVLWLKAQGLTGVRGPTNPTMNDVSGLLVDGFDREPAILMPYNPPYYHDFLLKYGFSRAMTMWAYYIHKKYRTLDHVIRGAEIVRKRYPNITIRTLDMSRFKEEAAAVLDIYNEAWSRNWGHVPMTQREFEQLARELKQIVDPRIVYLLEDDGEPVAFSIALPDLNELLKHNRGGRLFPTGLPKILARAKFCGVRNVRVPLMGVRLAYQGRGLDALMTMKILTEGPGIGYDSAEMSWVLDSNKRLINHLHAMNGVKDKEYAMLEMSLQ